MTSPEALPVAIIGAGPVGLAAAAHLIRRGLPVKVYEAGETVGAHVRDWGHVRLFSPWEYNVDAAARSLLLSHGWQEPPPTGMPTGTELYDGYLKPLAATPEMAAAIETGARVAAVTRHGADKVMSKDREARSFVLVVSLRNGSVRRDLARAVIDASGTWANPNPLGAGGVPAEGEVSHADRIAYGIPDVLGRDRTIYEGRKTLVIGAGHSAANVLLDLARLTSQDRGASPVWVTRSHNLSRVYGGGRADKLPARGDLGSRLNELVDSGRVTLVSGFAANRVRPSGDQIILEGETREGLHEIGPVDRIVVTTGQRPDLSMTRELRLDLDPWLESSKALGPLIDPNLHSCGSVPPHGHRALAHPEPGFYTVGVKSYGRAPTFLMLTGYEQVRSIVAALAGDVAAADHIRLVLPETGVCSIGGPPPVEVAVCCGADAKARAEEKARCGCGAAA